MNLLRSLVLALAMILVTPPMGIIALLTFPFSPHTRHRIISTWTHIVVWFIRHVTGIRERVIGRENMPDQPSVILCKHQSAWETILLQKIFPPQVYVLKKELLRLPFLGWGLAQMPNIGIDRKAGKDALRQVAEQGRARLREGFWVVVFPEGTRAAVGKKLRFKVGGAHLAVEAGVPVVPVAHNAGEFWPRNSFLKHPGEVLVSIGPPIYPDGLTAAEVNAQAEAWIDAEMHRLFPHHYAETPDKPRAAAA